VKRNHAASLIHGLLLALIMASSGCEVKNPTEGVRVLFNEDPLTLVTVEVVDAKTGEQIITAAEDGVRLSVGGKDKLAVTDLTEKPQTLFASRSGFFSFAIAESHDVSTAEPVKLTLTAESGGYLSTSSSITVTSTGGTFTIVLIHRSNPPEGITSDTNFDGAAGSEGTITETIEISSQPDPRTGIESSLRIPEGTVACDADGEALSGPLSASVTQITLNTEESVSSLPGGLFTSVTLNGVAHDTVFIPAVVVALELSDENGRIAQTFDRPIDVSFQIPGDTVNTQTSEPVRDGGTVPIWYYDDDSSSWVYETDGTASGPDARGNFTISFTITHFSYWAGGWEDTSGGICEDGLTVRVNGGFTAVDVKFRKTSDGTYFSALTKNVSSSDPFVRLSESPDNIPITVEAWYGKDPVGSVDIADLCGADIDLTVFIPGKAVTFSVEVYDRDNPDQRMRPNRGIYIDDNGYRKYAGYMKDGVITIYGLTEGITYTFWVFHENTWYSGTHMIGIESSVELEFAVEP